MRTFFKLSIVALLFFPIALLGTTKKGYEIKIKVGDIKDTVCYLANYFGDKTYLTDTSDVDASGRFTFKGEEPLAGGIYIVALGKTRLFEFLVDKSQFFSLETTGPDYVKNMKIKGSPENQAFYDYMMFNQEKYVEAEPWQKLVKKVANNKDSTKLVKDALDSINKKVEDYKLGFIKNNPGTLMAGFFNVMRDVDIPPAPTLPNGKKDSAFLYNYYRNHFWDKIDLLDERLLRTPIYQNKFTTYFEKVLVQSPDTIIKDADRMIEIVRPNKEMFKFLVWYLTNWSETSNVMGFDKVFVHMVQTYYQTNQAYWANPTVVENLNKRAKKLDAILIGRSAPNMMMLDTNMMPQSLLSVKAKYTVVFFWDPECGHCKVESPKLKKFYDDNKAKYDLEVFAVCSDTNMVKMKEYIKKNNFNWINVNGPRSVTPNYHDVYDIYSTPVIYLLDDKKIILAKRLLVDQLEKFIERYDANLKTSKKE